VLKLELIIDLSLLQRAPLTPTAPILAKLNIHQRASLCGSVRKAFVYHACAHEFESRLMKNFYFPNWLLAGHYRGMGKWFGAHDNQKVRFSLAAKCKN